MKDQLKGIVTKPFEKSLEAEKKSFQELVATYAAGAATALCANPLCGAAGSALGWYAGGKAFDKAVETAVFSTFSGPRSTQTPAK
jgi:hypothetical protein